MQQPPTPPPAVTPAPEAAPAPSPAPAGAPWLAAARPWNTAPWLAQHESYVTRTRMGGIDAVFLGDSIIEFFASRAPDVWSSLTQRYGSVVDYGISGDRTQFVLWRLQHGELDGLQPRAVVLLIGTNNLAVSSAEGVARGILAVANETHARVPGATVLVCGLLPRGAANDPLRAKAAAVNALLQRALAENPSLRYVAPPDGFITADGTLDATLLPDGLHPAAAGYALWSTALRPALDAVFGT